VRGKGHGARGHALRAERAIFNRKIAVGCRAFMRRTSFGSSSSLAGSGSGSASSPPSPVSAIARGRGATGPGAAVELQLVAVRALVRLCSLNRRASYSACVVMRILRRGVRRRVCVSDPCVFGWSMEHQQPAVTHAVTSHSVSLAAMLNTLPLVPAAVHACCMRGDCVAVRMQLSSTDDFI
jgi:hypothetical protein